MRCIESSVMSWDHIIHVVQKRCMPPQRQSIFKRTRHHRGNYENQDPAIKAQSSPNRYHVALATIPSFPNLSITPSFNLRVLSISLNGIRCKSRIFNAC